MGPFRQFFVVEADHDPGRGGMTGQPAGQRRGATPVIDCLDRGLVDHELLDIHDPLMPAVLHVRYLIPGEHEAVLVSLDLDAVRGDRARPAADAPVVDGEGSPTDDQAEGDAEGHHGAERTRRRRA